MWPVVECWLFSAALPMKNAVSLSLSMQDSCYGLNHFLHIPHSKAVLCLSSLSVWVLLYVICLSSGCRKEIQPVGWLPRWGQKKWSAGNDLGGSVPVYQGMAFLFLSARKHTFFTAGAAEYTHDLFFINLSTPLHNVHYISSITWLAILHLPSQRNKNYSE